MILFIDTSARKAKIAVKKESQILLDEFEGGRELDSLILNKIDLILKDSGIGFNDLDGIVTNIGPGSFTGLRIGLSVANALGYGLNIPVIGVANETDAEKIIEKGIIELKNKKIFEKPVLAEYGTEPNITKPKGN